MENIQQTKSVAVYFIQFDLSSSLRYPWLRLRE